MPGLPRSFAKICGLGALALLCAGCGRPAGEYFPLREGVTWSYRVRAGFVVRVEEVRVLRPIAVAGARGWELASPMGGSRLAWSGGWLVAESLPGARFSPALPLLAPARPSATWNWPEAGDGYATFGGTTIEARAVGRQRPETLEVGGREYETLRSTVELSAGGERIELDTWFAPGIGPLRQEQRTNGLLVGTLERVAGP
jgi:hypothetical protein